jgi:uncharacterized membrane protein
MSEFAIALLVFLASHSIPASPGIRRRAVALVGERSYLILYAALSLGLLIWLISAAARAPHVPLWPASLGQYYLPLLAMPPALFLLIGGVLCPNPLSVSFSSRPYDPDRPGVVAITRHPVLWGFALWSLAHVVSNGDLVAVIMFGGFGLFAFAGMWLVDRRKRRALGARWAAIAAGTSIIPLLALLRGAARLEWRSPQLAATILLTVASYAALLWLHPWLFGVDPKLAIPGLH